MYGGAGANPEWFESVTVKSMSETTEALEAKCVEMYVTKSPDNGQEYSEAEY